MNDYRKIPCVIQRGGTSKGVYIHEKDLPKDIEIRKKVVLAIFGSPDIRQIDGLGGADPLTSKVAFIAPSERQDADIDYTMGQVSINDPIIDHGGNCGNISSGVGPFAVDEGLVEPKEPETLVRIYNTNTKKILKAFVPVSGGKAKYTGDYAIDGVPGTSSKILLDYSATGGTVNGNILPTGRPVDIISVPGIGEFEVSVVDAGNPTCFIRPDPVGLSGTEGPDHPDVLKALDRLEIIRGSVSKLIGLASDADRARTESPTRPMIAVVSRSASYKKFTDGSIVDHTEMDFTSRLFFMQVMHKTYPGTGTVCTGAAAMIEGTIVHDICGNRPPGSKTIRIGHPSGTISIEVDVDNSPDGPVLKLAAFGRTSRRIMEGFVYVPSRLFD